MCDTRQGWVAITASHSGTRVWVRKWGSEGLERGLMPDRLRDGPATSASWTKIVDMRECFKQENKVHPFEKHRYVSLLCPFLLLSWAGAGLSKGTVMQVWFMTRSSDVFCLAGELCLSAGDVGFHVWRRRIVGPLHLAGC